MGTSQLAFVYGAAELAQLELLLSTERLSSYIGSSKQETIRKYESNTVLAEGLYGVLQGVEIAIRNSIHNTMSIGLSRKDWYGYVSWDTAESDALDQAKDKLTRRGKPLSPGNIVAELTFGFWVQLTATKYEKGLWVPYIHKAFPHIKTNRKGLFSRLRRIKDLRNRIAHHERISHFNLRVEYLQIMETTGWICPTTMLWIDSTNRLKPLLK
jgi:hypothetical protein